MAKALTNPTYRDVATIERGLMVLAQWNGNYRRAHKDLAEQGIDIPAETLRGWKRSTHAERYLEIRDETLPATYARVSDDFHQMLKRNAEVEEKASAKLSKALDDGDIAPRDLSSVARNAAVGAAVAFDKVARADARPTEMKIRNDISDLLRQAKAEGLDPSKLGLEEETPIDVEVEEA